MDQTKIMQRLESYESQISNTNDTKSDVSYHRMKQSLHNMWSTVYSTDNSGTRTANIKRIQECLSNLERKVTKNEQKKYMNYYSGHAGFEGASNRGAKCC
ncbi:uncharacterized protein LOC132699901 isoform X2 [Cylas formicarius]|nr:uncharacterized protein LOC132699901 isoform X2 [Cylas formicarius]